MKCLKFELGEKRLVRIRILSTENTFFKVEDAKFELWRGQTKEAEGIADVQEVSETVKIVSALIEPEMVFNPYKLLICYTINAEEFKVPIMIEVVK